MQSVMVLEDVIDFGGGGGGGGGGSDSGGSCGGWC